MASTLESFNACYVCMPISFHSWHFHGLFLSSPGLTGLNSHFLLPVSATWHPWGPVERNLSQEQPVEPLGPLSD